MLGVESKGISDSIILAGKWAHKSDMNVILRPNYIVMHEGSLVNSCKNKYFDYGYVVFRKTHPSRSTEKSTIASAADCSLLRSKIGFGTGS